MFKFQIIFLFVFCLLGADSSQAQQNEQLVEIINIPDKSVYQGIQDQSGFIWLATYNGLYRYDGQRFEIFNTNSTTKLSSNRIQVIREHKQTIWVGTNLGVDILDLRSYTTKSLKIKDDLKLSIVDISSRGDTVWIMSNEGIIYRYELEKLSAILSNPFSSDGTFGSHPRMLMTKQGLLVSSENEGCFKINGNKPSSVIIIPSSSDESHWGFFKSKTDSVYTYGKSGVEVLSKEQQAFHPFEEFTEHVYFFLKDYKGDCWIVNKGRQNIAKRSSLRTFSTNYHFDIKRNIHVNSLFEDDSKNMWVCTNNGLFKITNDEAKFTSMLGADDERISNRIPSYRGICEDVDGSLYIGGYGGLYQLKNDSIRSFLKDSLTYCPYIIMNDGDSLWIATEGKGMMHIDKTTGKHQFHQVPYSKNYQFKYRYLVCSLKENDSTIWLSDYESIFQFNPKTKEFQIGKLMYQGEDLAQHAAKQFLISSANEMWIASHIGLIKLNESREVINLYNNRSSPALPDDMINTLLEDTIGNIWIGFMNTGLAKLDPNTNTLELITENEGLPDNRIASMLSDNQGNIWVGTNNGLSEFNIKTNTISNYFEQDGLADNEFNHGSIAKLTNGDLLFGGINGLTRIPAIPPVTSYESNKLILSKIELINEDGKVQPFYAFNQKQGITLDYQNRYLNVEFSLADYQHSDKNVFYYMLEGYDNDWTYLGNKSNLQFASLPFGEYTLRIKGMSASGIWSQANINIPLKVNQVFYKSFWFLFLLFLSISGIVWYIVTMKMKRLKEIANMRIAISSDLHDDVGSVLTRVAMEAEILQEEATGEQRNSLHEIAASCRSAMGNMRDVVWSIDSRNNLMGSLFDKLREFTRNMLEDSRFVYQIDIDEKVISLAISPYEKREIYLIYKEAINNILKHSNGNIVHVHVLLIDSVFSLSIFDNGRPTLNPSSSGSGCKNMLMRANKIGATLTTDKTYGYKVELKMRIKKSFLWN